MRSKIAPISWVVLLSVVPAGLYYMYVSAQLQYITELNQRELGRAAENLKEIFRNGVQTVKNLTTKPKYTCAFNERQPYLYLSDGLDCNSFYKPSDKEKTLEASDIKVRVADSGLRVVATDLEANHRNLSFDIKLEKALDELVVADGFEYLFLTRGDGTVLFQTRRGERKRWLDQLRWFDRHARDESVPVSNPLRLQKVAELHTAAGPVAFAGFSRTSNSVPVQIGGTAYRLHVQPLLSLSQLRYEKHVDPHKPEALEPGETPESNDLVLGGLVSESSSAREAQAIEPLYALVLALLVVVGILSWPLVKFFVLAPRERFTFLDFALLILGTSATVGFFTILIIDAEAHWRMKSIGETRLKDLANRLQDDFTGEIGSMYKQLMQFDTLALKLENANRFNCSHLLEGRRLLDTFKDSTDIDQLLQVRQDAPYPSFISAFWASGKDGLQFGKLTTSDENTSRVGVASRNYFTEAQSGHLWKVTPEERGEKTTSSDAPRGFFLQGYRSSTTGDFETGLSMRSRLKVCDPERGEPDIAVLTSRLWSFRARALPPDMGFMVIDRSGRVIYHSDERRALREDLFEETTNPASLRAIVLNERPAGLVASYRGAPHRLWIQPIDTVQVSKREPLEGGQTSEGSAKVRENIGWFLVTFQDLELSRTVNSEAMISVLVWSFVYFLIVQFIPAAVFIWMGPAQMAWLWPNYLKARLYARLTVALAAVSVAGIVFVTLATGWTLMVGAYAIGAAGVIVSIVEYRRWLKSPEATSATPNVEPFDPQRIGWSRVAEATLFVVVMSVLPAAGLFKFSWNQEIGALLQYEKNHIQNTENDLREELEERARKQFIRVYPGQWRKLMGRVFHAQLAAITNPLDTGFHGELNDGEPDVLAGLKPVYNDASAQLRYRPSSPLPADAPLRARPGVFGVLSCAALICALGLWTRHASKRLLLSDVTDRKEPITAVLENVKKAMNDNQNQILVVTSGAQEQALRKQLGIEVRRAAAAAVGADTLTSPSKQGLSLTEVLFEPDSRRAALRDVEALAAAGGAVLFSRVDPVDYFIRHALAAADPSFTRTEQRQWADALERFAVVRVPVADEDPPGKQDSDAVYWSFWDSCTDLEKLVLLHVAQEGFANPREHKTVRDLLHRGLLVLGPELRVFSAGFHRFLQQVCDNKVTKQLERPRGFGWGQTKWVLLIGVAGVIVFLVSTQQKSLGPVITFVATLTGAISGVLKLVADFSPKQRSG